MKSPFAIFRKHQKTLLVVATFMAMFAFIFLDTLRRADSRTVTLVLGMMLGAGVGWILGAQRKHPSEFALGGAIAGGLIGFFAVGGPTQNIAVKTKIGNLTEPDMQSLQRSRTVATQFALEAFRRTAPETARYMPRDPFQLVQGLDARRDVLLGYLLRTEAKKMGISLGDAAVNNFVLAWTSNKLSRNAFEDIRRQMHVAASALYQDIADQLLASQTLRLLAPSYGQTPEQLWEMYRKLNVREELDTAAVPVEAFESDVKDPPEGTLQAYFEKHKAVFPGANGPGSPGFRQPRRVRIAYVEAEYLEVEKQIPEISEAEISKFYEEHKDERYRNRPFPEQEAPKPPGDDAAKPEPGTASVTPPDGSPTDADTKPLSPEFAPEPAPGSPPSKANGTSTEEAAPKTDPPTGQKSSGLNNFPKGETPSDELAAADDTDSTVRTVSNFVDASDDDSPGNVAPAVERAPAEDSADNGTSKDQPAATVAKPVVENAATPAPDAKPSVEDAATAAPADEPPPEKTSETPADLPEFRPLDEELKSEIRDELLRERTLALLQEKIRNVQQSMSDVSLDILIESDIPDSQQPQKSSGDGTRKVSEVAQRKISSAMKKLADSMKLRYVETRPVSAAELVESEEYPIGKGVEPSSNPFDRDESRTVQAILFGAQAEQVYIPHVAEDPVTSNRYAYWKFDDIEGHVPTFDEPGIRAEVLNAWKTEQARPQAKSRAEELAQHLRQGDRNLFDVLNGQTITGKPDSPPLVLRQTESFSWLRLSNVPSFNPYQPQAPELSTISAIDGADNDFMRTVFSELKDGETGVLPNADRSVYYVVRVKNRVPSTDVGLEALREGFLRENLFYYSPYAVLGAEERYRVVNKWIDELQVKYGVRWEAEARPR